VIAAVLVIPAEGDPGGLLREGPCGARPPTVCRRRYEDNEAESWRPFLPDLAPKRTGWRTERALVLAWGGDVVAEGRNSAARAVAAAAETSHSTKAGAARYHRVELRDPRPVCVPHRHGGSALRLDGWCAGCMRESDGAWGPSFQHEEWLLPYVNGNYVGANEIGRLDHGAPGTHGERIVDVHALGIALVARGLASRVVLLDAKGREVAGG
jgi:hypothetical protein